MADLLPENFFKPWETVASGWASSQESIQKILTLATPDRDLVWRGVGKSSYALHSSLYRRLMITNSVPPDEDAILKFETDLLQIARKRWRFDNLTALEILAHLQHYGGPTRLLDVSFNPLVALWFAVEQKFGDDGKPLPDTDGRLFIFDVTDRQIDLDATWGQYELPWTKPQQKWQTGLPMVWRPPSYNDRIPAQNSAFLIGGVPQVSKGQNSKYRKAPGNGSKTAGAWSISEVRKATSVTLSMNGQTQKLKPKSTPTFTIRIEASGKPEIRRILERSYGFNVSSIYPDLFGLARYGANGL
jgi:FRG domain